MAVSLLVATNIIGVLLLMLSAALRIGHSLACRHTTWAFHIQATALLLLAVTMVGRSQLDGTLFELVAGTTFAGLLLHTTVREHRRRQVLVALHTNNLPKVPTADTTPGGNTPDRSPQNPHTTPKH